MAISGGPDIVEDGLLLCLDAADKNSYPGTGNTVYDLSGNNKNLILVNSPTYSASNGGHIVYDGLDDYSYTEPLSYTNGTSISFWIYGISWSVPNCPCANAAGILDWSNGFWNMIGIISNTGGPYVNVSASSDSYNRKNLSFNCSGDLNKWLYLTATYDDATRTLKNYKNAASISSATIVDSCTLTNIRIYLSRYIRHCGNCASNIIMPSLTIHNRALSPDEILQNYNATKGRYGL